jgi:3-dehydroquinate dehydratase-1
LSQAIDEVPFTAHYWDMAQARLSLTDGRPMVVGSFGNRKDLATTPAAGVREACDIVEIRLDLVTPERAGMDPAPWSHLRDMPLLFTARRHEEGGGRALAAATRMGMLETVLEQAAAIDLEVASIGEMDALLKTLAHRGIPWVASFHDFGRLPDAAVLLDAVTRARAAGAGVFKVAAMLHEPADLARLAEFQLADHGMPVATMGMGLLAAVSRLLCAQCGSVLNYGYLGETATAPGQWDAALLKTAISRVAGFAI